MQKLYLITRSDLSPAQQAVQAAHALQAFNLQHETLTRQWYATSNTLALLAVPDEAGLGKLLELADAFGVDASAFREPDHGDSLTAIALGPGGKRLCRGIPLALTPT